MFVLVAFFKVQRADIKRWDEKTDERGLMAMVY